MYRATGRPKIVIDMEDVELLRSLRFSWTKVAAIVGVSRSTLYRRLEEEGVSTDLRYTTIGDEALDRLIYDIKQEHPNDGERLMMGHLISRGVMIPRSRLRGSIHRVDPINTAVRRSFAIRRRRYHVNGPNAMWHLDGHHKLIRWRIVTHAGIDGYSRSIVFIKCANNNRATTMFSAFQSAVRDYGLPEKIRTDLGGENVEVWRYMVEQHSDSSAVLTGSSTHNERIERLWRDVFRCVGSVYYDVFRELEDEGSLDPLNAVDMYCLHYIFVPRVNEALSTFMDSWNNHAVSTARNLTPNQLFVQGAIEYGMTPNMVLPSNPLAVQATRAPTPGDTVNVPSNRYLPCVYLKQQLCTQVNPLSNSDCLGSDLYRRSVHIVGQHLANGCQVCT